jgi:hypothetical protein
MFTIASMNHHASKVTVCPLSVHGEGHSPRINFIKYSDLQKCFFERGSDELPEGINITLNVLQKSGRFINCDYGERNWSSGKNSHSHLNS